MLRLQHFFCFMLFILLTSSLSAQRLIEATFLETRTQSEIAASSGADAQYDVDLYRVLYETNDITGLLDTASGLFAIPVEVNTTFPLLCYQHGTVDGREDVPSNLEGGSYLTIVLASMGYFTTAADYLGLGTARGVHPYVHADSEASAAIDLMYSAREFADQQDDIRLNDQVFITGYSQGGHAAMAAHREIQQNFSNDFTVTAAAPMSGPFSISGAMREFTTSDETYLFVAYIAWTALSYQAAYGNIYEDLSEIFKPNFVINIEQFEREEIGLFGLNAQLIFKLNQQGDGIRPKFMLQDSLREIVVNNGEHPLMDALRDNDVYDWTPNAPTRLYYCTADDQVTFQNSIIAEAKMIENGATDIAAIDVASNQNHGGCVEPATQATIDFFAQFQELTVGTDDQFVVPQLKVFPNPASDELTIINEASYSANTIIRLMDMTGKLVRSIPANQELTTVEVADLPQGIYYLELINDQQSRTGKVVIE